MQMNMSISLDHMHTLIIGSMTLDVLLYMQKLPATMADVNVEEQHFQIGGCAYNVYQSMRYCGQSALLLSSMGTGIYAQQLKELVQEDPNIIFEEKDAENGCCYCLIEEGGERTFLSVHGAEYHYPLKKLQQVREKSFAYVYLCGIDLEQAENTAILSWLDGVSATLFFAPGPRGILLQAAVWDSLYALHPILHVNEKEAFELSGCRQREEAIQKIFALTQQLVIVTLGADGSMAYDGKQLVHVPAFPCKVVDCVGAGDAHAGACLTMLHKEASIKDMLHFANSIAAKALEQHGSLHQ